MWDFNIVVTMAREGRFRNFYGELARYGEFRRTEFYGLLLGRLAEPEVFLETVRREREARVIAFQDLGRAIPLRTVFTFCPRNFLERARKALLPFAKELAGRRFYVRLERRGFKGEILSPEAERALDRALLEELEGRGNPGGDRFPGSRRRGGPGDHRGSLRSRAAHPRDEGPLRFRAGGMSLPPEVPWRNPSNLPISNSPARGNWPGGPRRP